MSSDDVGRGTSGGGGGKASAAASGNNALGSKSSGGGPGGTISAGQLQLTKLRDANAKYKNLLKMAKERIQTQEDELGLLRGEIKQLQDQKSPLDPIDAESERPALTKANNITSSVDDADAGAGSGDSSSVLLAAAGTTAGPASAAAAAASAAMAAPYENSSSIVRVIQRIKVQTTTTTTRKHQQQQQQQQQQQEQQSREEKTDSGNNKNDAFAIIDDENNTDNDDDHDGFRIEEEIWAFVEFATTNHNNSDENNNPPPQENAPTYKKWIRFDSDSHLDDYIRRDTGEPIALPPYSLSPEESLKIQFEARQEVSSITEDFRRFRVRAELSRKQSDNTIKELQNNHVLSAKRRIEGHGIETELEQARSERRQLERLRAEITQQESDWKEAYDVLLAENNALKSSGSEALLASQWRQRYEACLNEKEEIATRFKSLMEKAKLGIGGSTAAVINNNNNGSIANGSTSNNTPNNKKKDTHGSSLASSAGDASAAAAAVAAASASAAAAAKYEAKYRDLKESFRVYRKKAKEIFEAQQGGNVTSSQLLSMDHLGSGGEEDSKLNYLKNLMINYLSAEVSVREHMEVAIGTVLQFTPDDINKIKEKKKEAVNANWF